MNPVTITDLTNFMHNIIGTFDSYLYYSITFMFAAHALVLVRRLFVGVKQ